MVTALTWVGVGACCVSAAIVMGSTKTAWLRAMRSSLPPWEKIPLAISEVLIRAVVYVAFLAGSAALLTTIL